MAPGREPADPARHAGFEALRRRFVTGLPDRWREIDAAPDPATRAAALHRLAGAAGTYGFSELGTAARAAERLVAGAGPPEAVDAALAQVNHLLREATQA